MNDEPQVTSTHCCRGHLRTTKGTRWYHAKNGRSYPICRKCESIVRNARYATDLEYRAWSREKSHDWYWKNRANGSTQQENV